MEIVTTVAEMRKTRQGLATPVGLVPTMGYLHEGHLSLLRMARSQNRAVVMSLFVNPTQFGPSEDFERYPRDFQRDSSMAEAEGVDILFAPTVQEVYPPGYSTSIDVGPIAARWEGERRPGHFRGVATVVAKLFTITEPAHAYFGEKDYQQFQVIRRVASDLDLPVAIVGCPTVREPDGLAMSSRNFFLKAAERARATVLYRSLLLAKEMVQEGEKEVRTILAAMERLIGAEPAAKLDYVAIVDPRTLEPLVQIAGPARALIATYVGPVRLIDNMALNLEEE